MGLFDRPKQAPTGEPFEPQKYNAARPLTASAARVDLKDKKQVDAISKRRKADTWQEEAWEYFDLIGEIKSSANLIANVMSRINLYGGYVHLSSSIPADISTMDKVLDVDFIDAVQDTLYILESGNGGTSGLLRNAALNMFIVGECYLVREPAKFGSMEPTKYNVRSIDEVVAVSSKNSQVAIRPRRDSKPSEFQIISDESGYVCRMWRNHPRFSDEADSSLRGILDNCDDLLLISRAASATAKSRLNGGLLFVPDGLSNVSQSDGEINGEEGNLSDDVADSFEEELIDAMTTPIADVSSASAVVPLVVRGPEELGDKIKLIKFERMFDPQIAKQGDRLLERILAGLDIPMDVAKGLSGVKYSNAILIEEQLYKAHIEPLILLIVDQLTIGFLRPALRAQGFPESIVNRAVVWYDPSSITAKPSKAEAAVTLYGLNAISETALRRSNGFSEGDAPSDLERSQKLAYSRGLLDEQTSATLFRTMIPEEILAQARQDSLAVSDPSSANALVEATTGEDVPAEGTDEEQKESPTLTSIQAPPTLMEP